MRRFDARLTAGELLIPAGFPTHNFRLRPLAGKMPNPHNSFYLRVTPPSSRRSGLLCFVLSGAFAMAEFMLLKAQPRDQFGTANARRLRRKGMLPAVVYGHKEAHL